MSATRRSTDELRLAFEDWRNRFETTKQNLDDLVNYQEALRETGCNDVPELTAIVNRFDVLLARIDTLRQEHAVLMREARG
jgi:hypothetical protein